VTPEERAAELTAIRGTAGRVMCSANREAADLAECIARLALLVERGDPGLPDGISLEELP